MHPCAAVSHRGGHGKADAAVKIPQEEFLSWAESAYLSTGHQRFTWKILSKLTGYSQPRLSMQKGRGYIESFVVIAFSRGLGLDPVQQLLTFPYFGRLLRKDDPTEEEVLALVSTQDLTRELQYRLGAPDRGDQPLSSEPENLGFLRWYDAAVKRGESLRIAEEMNITPTVLSSRNIRNTWSMGELHDMCEAGDLNYRMSLVAAGHITLEEAGYGSDLRERTLENVADDQFFTYLRQALGHMARQARAVTDLRRMSEHLG